MPATPVHLTDQALDLAALLTETVDPAAGALAVFGGTVRNHHAGRAVSHLIYSCYEPIANQQMAAIEQEALGRFEIAQCRLQHRIGELQIGDTAVYVVVRSAHRQAAFDAARFAIDTVKERVPIWKQEFFPDGSSEYVDGHALYEESA